MKFLIILFLILSLNAQEKLSSSDFLEMAQNRLLQQSWMKLKGKIAFLSKQGKHQKSDLVLNGTLNLHKITMQAIVKDEKVKFSITTGDIHETVIDTDKNPKFLEDAGIQVQDLSLAILFGNLIHEPKKKTIQGYSCRVLLLANPDNLDEKAKVFISEKYLAPLKIEWYKTSKATGRLETEPYKTLEFNSIDEKNDLWYPSEIELTTPKGNTKIKFEEDNVKINKGLAPKDLYE